MPEVTSPADWERTSLAGLAEYINGFAFSESYWSAEGLPIVRIAQITGSQGIVDRFQGQLSDAYRLVDGDLIFSWSGTLAVVRWSGGPAWLNQHLFKVVPRKGLDRDLLFHVLQASVAEMDKRAHGSTMKHIKRGELREFRVSLPVSGNEQRTVAQVLDTLDTTIRQTEAIIEKLKQVKQGLLHDLLTRGIDGNGELRPPQSQAPHLYKDSPLGWIPAEWASPCIREVVADGANGASIRADEFCASGTPVIAKGDVTTAKYIDTCSRVQFVKPALASSKYKASMINRSFVVCSMRDLVPSAPTLGMASLLDADMDGLLAQGTTALRLDQSRFDSELFVEVTRLPWFRTKMRALAVGSTQVHMRGRDFLNVAIPTPPIEEQREIVARIEAADSSMRLNRHTSMILGATKSGLMDDLLTGRVRVNPLLD